MFPEIIGFSRSFGTHFPFWQKHFQKKMKFREIAAFALTFYGFVV